MKESEDVVEQGQIHARLEIQQQKVRSDLLEQYIYYRCKKCITQQELAERLHVSRQVVTRFESKQYNPTLDMMVKLAEGLGMELEIRLVEKTPFSCYDK